MKKVIDFYKDIPFNFTEDLDFYIDNLVDVNQVLEYSDLHDLCLKRKNIYGKKLIENVIEFGCGTGWLTNTLSYTYKKDLTSVDFTSKAIAKAKAVSKKLNVEPSYICSDIFDYKDQNLYDLVISLGVLHHTKNCYLAFEKITSYIKTGGYIYIGLYHYWGRKPMLDFLKSYTRWYGENSAFNLFKKMSRNSNNIEHSYSWFRDQVLHPHETQHTLEEVSEWLEKFDLKLKSTSINSYKSISNISQKELFKLEREMYDYSYKKNVLDLEFTPGYFTVCAQKV